jgi:glycosyltransferase involved in cell wall biosynthesis
MDSFEGIRICFLADKHDLYDDRIYWKMAVPLHQLGSEVHCYLIGEEDASGTTAEGIIFKSWKRKSFSGNLFVNHALKRLDPANNYQKLFQASASLKADIYHFHDLWINRIAPGLKALPHRPVVFYDAREPHADDFRSFYAAGRFSSAVVNTFATWVDRWEKQRAKCYDLLIATEPIVRDRFAAAVGEDRAVVIYNYSNWGDLSRSGSEIRDPGHPEKKYDLIYCGMLTEPRGAFAILETLRALRYKRPEIKLLLLGRIDTPVLKERMLGYIREHELEKNIEIRGQVAFEEVGRYYRKSRIGLILWKPLESLKIKMPIKLFEYMAFGLPVIGSDFGHISEYIKKERCGVAVDPENAAAVAEAIGLLLDDPDRFNQMSRNGKDATLKKYSWKGEFERLCDYYRQALDERRKNITH